MPPRAAWRVDDGSCVLGSAPMRGGASTFGVTGSADLHRSRYHHSFVDRLFGGSRTQAVTDQMHLQTASTQ